MAKKYYWLKLKNDFFTQPKIKKLRRLAGGDTLTIIYLKLQLLSLQNEGKLYFEGIEDTFAEELSLTIDEDKDNILLTLQYLVHQGLIEEVEQDEYVLTETTGLIGSETAGAERVRRMREKEKKALQCNTPVTSCNTEIEIEKEKELDKEIEIEQETEREGEELSPTIDAKKTYLKKIYDSWSAHQLPLSNASRGNFAMFETIELRPVLSQVLAMAGQVDDVLQAIDNAAKVRDLIEAGGTWYSSPDLFRQFVSKIDRYLPGAFDIAQFMKKQIAGVQYVDDDKIEF